jgi:uncharacterized OB-fold protein
MSEAAALRPVVPFLKNVDSQPYLEGLVCKACERVFLDLRKHCSACGARDAMLPRRLSDHGTLHAYTIIHRSFPGVPVPYVSAIVDLDGGGCVKGNLLRVPIDPARIASGMRVRLIYEQAPQRDKDGGCYLAYFFVPEGDSP